VEFASGALSQGTSIVSVSQRSCDIQPKLGAGSESHELIQISFGQSGHTWDSRTPFNEHVLSYDVRNIVLLYVSGVDASIGSLVEGMSADMDPRHDFDGIIEVLDIRTTFVNYPGHPRCGFGRMIRSSPDVSVNIIQHVSTDEPLLRSFVEAGVNLLTSLTVYTSSLAATSGSVVYAAEKLQSVTGTESVTSPFDDTSYVSRTTPKSTLTTDRQLFTYALQQLTGSSEFGDSTRRKFAACGSTYHDSTYGTDSIAFGGMMGYRS
jgi:hypothetical protein